MEENKGLKAVDKLRFMLAWCDNQCEDFVAQFQTVGDIEKCYNSCQKYGIEFADKLTWDKEEPNYVDDPQFLLAKDVNNIMMRYYYATGELTIGMLTQAKKEFVELLHKVEELNFDTAFQPLNGYNRESDQFNCNYKSLTVTVMKDYNGKCSLYPNVEIWDGKHVLNFHENFDELLYGHGFGCLAVDDLDYDLFTREVDVRDVLGLPGHKFDIGSKSLFDYFEKHPQKREEFRKNGWLPILFVPDEDFDSEYFNLVDKVMITLFAMYEDYVTCEPSEIVDDLAFYTGKRVKTITEITDEDWHALILGVENEGIKWREFVQCRIL